jgi:hypothetical protein
MEAKNKLNEGDFEALEKIAKELRASKEMYFQGTWALNSFYLGCGEIGDKTPEPDCKQLLERLQAWRKAKPASVTARVALSRVLSDYAWKARGNGWVDTVTDDGAKQMADRLAESWAVLEEAKTLPEKCPGWFCAAASVALGQGWNSARLSTLEAEAVAYEPEYHDFYSAMALIMEPRWHGVPGQVERFFEKYAALRKGIEADVFYARAVWQLDLRRLDKNFFEAHPGLKWPMVTRGFDELLTRFPDSLTVRSEFARLAFKAKDKPRAKAMFDQIGMNFDARTWFTPSTFDQYRKWAYEP